MYIFFKILTYTIITGLIFFMVVSTKLLLPLKEAAPEIKYLDTSNLTTGDIVVISVNKIRGKFGQFISGSNWNHSGVIYQDPLTNIQYVLEGVFYNKKLKTSFPKVLLSEWITKNRYHRICIMRLNGKLDPNLLLDKFRSFIDNSYLEMFNLGWCRFLKVKPFRKYSKRDYKKGFTCVEVTIRILQEAGVLDDTHSESSYLLSNLLRRQIKCKEPYSYRQPYQIVLGRSYVRGFPSQ